MYYSSDSSDNENAKDFSSLDLSYLLLDTESLGLQLKSSIIDYISNKKFENEYTSGHNKHDVTASFKNTFETENMNMKKSSTASFKDHTENDHGFEIDNHTNKLLLHHNLLVNIPIEITHFKNIRFLDLSNNNLTHINDYLICLTHLQTFYAKNNDLHDDSFPKDFDSLLELKDVNLSGNYLTVIPEQLYNCGQLKYLYLANNEITHVSPDIQNLQNLQVLQLGGNQLDRVPDELGNLSQLGVLALCNNKIKKLPRVISKLTRLRTLLLHKNDMCCLPVEIIKLKGLVELSLRDNPLVSKFIKCCAKDYMNTPPSLLELSARVIKFKNVPYSKDEIPSVLDKYINSGQNCVNPKCKGVYFTSCVEHVKFVDFCGKYRVPLMHYLCSSRCSSTTPTAYNAAADSESEDEEANRIRKVLLG